MAIKKSIPFIVIFVRKPRDKNWLPPKFDRLIWFLFAVGITVVLVGKFVLGYKIFTSF